MDDVLVIGGGPSLQTTHWRHLLTEMPSIAINHHAWSKEGIATDHFVQGDPPMPGDYTPVPVLEDETCAKYFMDMPGYRERVSQYPNVTMLPEWSDFDRFHGLRWSDAGTCAYHMEVLCTMNVCLRLLCGLKLRALHLVGVDLKGGEYKNHRVWLSKVVPELSKHWGMTFTSLAKDNTVECFESAA